MSNNIFNPKGRIDRSTFIINYVVLATLYLFLASDYSQLQVTILNLYHYQ